MPPVPDSSQMPNSQTLEKMPLVTKSVPLAGKLKRARHGARRTVPALVAPDYEMARDVLAMSEDLWSEVFGKNSDLGTNKTFVAMRSARGSLPRFGWTLFEVSRRSDLKRGSCAVAVSHHTSSAQQDVLLAAVTPAVLKQAILSLPPALYDQVESTADSTAILEQLGLRPYRILRQGEYLPDVGARIQVCEPIDQGIVVYGEIQVTLVREDGPTTANQPDAESIDDAFEFEISKFLEDSDRTAADSRLTLGVSVLDRPMAAGSLVPVPGALDDLESAVFVRTEQLVKLGLFSGDLASVSSGSVTRTVRVFSYPEPNTVSANEVYMSPLLAFNMGAVETVTLEKLERQVMPVVAREVTISRVASPVTTDRVYQQSFLSALRSYFESSYRVVRLGDTIAVPIDTLLAQTLHAGGGSAGVMPAGKPNEVAWFKITSLESDEDQGNATECVIDPSATRMVQSGLVKQGCAPSRLRWRRYLGLAEFPDYAGAKTGAREGDFAYARKLKQVIETAMSPLARQAHLQSSVLVHSTKRGTGKTTLVHSVGAELGVHVFEIDCYSIIGDTDVKTVAALKARVERAAGIEPCIVLLKHLDNLAKKSEQDGSDGNGVVSSIAEVLHDAMASTDVLVVATAADIDKLSEAVRSKFKFEVAVGVPSESERRKMFEVLTEPQGSVLAAAKSLTGFQLRNVHVGFELAPEVAIGTLAQQSAGLTPPDLVSIVEAAKIKAMERIQNASDDPADVILCSRGVVKITSGDVEGAIGLARSKYSDSIGAPKIPNVQWKDVGGLEGVKKEILDTIEMPLKYPQLFSSGVKKRSGVLFYGPPGTGKTLLAKAIATTFSLNFFSVKGPELLNMYIGESEANVRRVFQKARDAKPCVVFFDELDSVAPKRGNQGDSGGVMDRIVSQLLAELDGMSGGGGEGVFVVGATNRPDLLDEALLRPGRFDKMLYLGISDTHDKQRNILQALTRKFDLSPDVSLQRIAEKCPFTYTGADFYAMSSDAMLNAMTRTAACVDEKIKAYNESQRRPQGLADVSTRWWFQHVATPDDISVRVTEADFEKALRELVPSVSAEELEHYLRVRANFEGGKKQPPQASDSTLSHPENGPPLNGSHRISEIETNGSLPTANGTTANGTTKPKKKNKGKGRMPDY